VLAVEAAVVLLARRPGADPDAARSTALLLGPLGWTTAARVGGIALGGIVVPFALAVTEYGPHPPPTWLLAGAGVAALVLVVAGEAAARTLFFRAELGPRMPGVPR
jgi:hypothetical protein